MSMKSRLAIILSILAVAGAQAAIIYVAPGGDDANSGLQPKQALGTIQRGVERVGPGDTLMIRGGVYHERVSVRCSGTDEEHRIVIQAYPGEKPVLDGEGLDVPRWQALLTFNGCRYITVRGLEVRRSAHDGVQVLKDSTHLKFESLRVHDCGATGLSMWALSKPAYVYVSDGEYWGNELAGIHAASVLGGYVVIEGNRVHHNRCAGNYDAIQTGIGDPGMGAHHVVVRGNLVYDNRGIDDGGGDAIDLGGRNDNMTHLLVDGNRLWGSNGLVKFSRTTRYAIMRRNQMTGGAFIDLYGPPYPACSIYHNTLYGTHHGVQLGVGDVGGADPLPRDVNWGGLQIRNNIFAFGASYILNTWTPKLNRKPDSVGLDGNLYRLGDGAPGRWYLDEWWAQSPDAHAVLTQASVKALFTCAEDNDLSLPEGSPAVDAAQPLTRALTDGSGKVLPVEDARYFVDGWDGLIEGDTIQVGANSPVSITAVDYDRQTITLRDPLIWRQGDPVSLPWAGSAPDIGALERRP